MESDTTVRRIKDYSGAAQSRRPTYNNGETRRRKEDEEDEEEKQEVKVEQQEKQEVLLLLLREGPGASLVSGFLLLLWLLVHMSLQQLVLGSDTGDFNAVRARRHLEHITSVGPRPVGSPENEVLTVGYLLEQIKHIQAEVEASGRGAGGPHHRLSVDVQRPTGSFSIDFLGGFTSFYDRITNVANRGASDDAVSCAVMLEVLHALANLSTPLRHGVVFLFNGAEENVLQIRPKRCQLPRVSVCWLAGWLAGWLPRVSLGSPGCRPWLHPDNTAPSPVFHARRCVRPCDNILAVLKHLVMSEELADSSRYRHGNMVFFDLLGLVVVAYPARVGTILNYLVAAATFCYLARKARRPGNGGGRYVRELACAAGLTVLSWVVTLLTVLTVALLVTLLGRSMFWYTHFYASVGLYGSAAAGSMVLVHTLAKNVYYGSRTTTTTLLVARRSHAAEHPGLLYYFSKEGVRLVSLSELYFDVSLLLWCCSLLLLTQRGLCSAYVSMLMVAFPLAAKTLLTAEFKHRGASAKYCVLYLLGLALPYVHFLFLIWVVFEIFTPILGRSGTEIPPEVVLATLVTLATIFLSSYF
ncbi:hypothetical protein CRUP_020645, partial [Coryphaenoides rupestris]